MDNEDYENEKDQLKQLSRQAHDGSMGLQSKSFDYLTENYLLRKKLERSESQKQTLARKNRKLKRGQDMLTKTCQNLKKKNKHLGKKLSVYTNPVAYPTKVYATKYNTDWAEMLFSATYWNKGLIDPDFADTIQAYDSPITGHDSVGELMPNQRVYYDSSIIKNNMEINGGTTIETATHCDWCMIRFRNNGHVKEGFIPFWAIKKCEGSSKKPLKTLKGSEYTSPLYDGEVVHIEYKIRGHKVDQKVIAHVLPDGNIYLGEE